MQTRQDTADELDMRLPMILADLSLETDIPEEELLPMLVEACERLRRRRCGVS